MLARFAEFRHFFWWCTLRSSEMRDLQVSQNFNTFSCCALRTCDLRDSGVSQNLNTFFAVIHFSRLRGPRCDFGDGSGGEWTYVLISLEIHIWEFMTLFSVLPSRPVIWVLKYENIGFVVDYSLLVDSFWHSKNGI